MHEHSFERPNVGASNSRSNSFVDMTDWRDLRSVFADQNNAQRNNQDGFLSFNDPYSDRGHTSFEPRQSHHHGHCHDHGSEDNSKDGSDHGSETNRKKNSDQPQMTPQELAKLILDVLKQLMQQAGEQQGSNAVPAETGSSGDSTQQPSPATQDSSSGSNSEGQTSPSNSGSSQGNSDSQHVSAGSNSQPIEGTVDAVWAQQDKNQATTYAEGDSADTNRLNSTHTDVPTAVPSDANGISSWGIVMGENGANVDRNSSAQIKDMQTYVHLKTGGWVKVEDENDTSNNSRIEGMTENTNFTNAAQMNVDHAGAVGSMAAPPAAGTMDHFGIANNTWTPGKFDPGTIDGVYITAKAKASENNSGLVAKLGADWWSNAGTSDSKIAGVPGTNNFTQLTDQWQTMYYTNLNKSTLESDPPPGISNDSSAVSSGSSEQTNNNSGDSATTAKLIIPFPASDAQWQQIINSAPKGSLVFPIYSGDNTKPDDFSQIGSNLARNVTSATDAGLKPIGYVGTNAGTKPLDQVKREIDDWYQNGGSIQGIYLGGSGKADGSGYATDPASEAYYSAIADYIHAKGGLAVINGVYGSGGSPNPDYMKSFDVQGAYEYYESNLANEDIKDNWQRNYSSDHFMAFVSGVNQSDMKSVVQRLEANNRGYIYVTDENYGQNPTYWNDLIDMLK